MAVQTEATNAPSRLASALQTNWASRHTGTFKANVAGDYTFSVIADDGTPCAYMGGMGGMGGT